MTQRCSAIVLLVGLLTTTAAAQDLAGQWQGVLQAGRALRVVIRITNAAAGPAATMHSIDQGGQALAASAVTVRDGAVRITFPIGATFDGRLSAEGNTLAGTWTQGPGSIPLTLTRVTGDAAWAIPEPPAAARPMPAAATPLFQVATIKPAQPDATGKAYLVRGRMVSAINVSLADLIAFTHGLHLQQITGGPAWVTTDRFDVSGQPDQEGVPNQQQLRGMFSRLLAERFNLALKRDTRDLPAYAIVVEPTGPRLTRSAGDPNGLPSLLFRGLGVLPAANASIADLASVLQTAVLDRPVVDQTALTGRFDFSLTWTPDESQFASMGVRVPPPTNDPAAPPGLFTAIREQLGLRLQPTTARVEVVIVERADRPTEN